MGNHLARLDVESEKMWSIDLHSKLPLIGIGCDKSVRVVGFSKEKISF